MIIKDSFKKTGLETLWKGINLSQFVLNRQKRDQSEKKKKNGVRVCAKHFNLQGGIRVLSCSNFIGVLGASQIFIRVSAHQRAILALIYL